MKREKMAFLADSPFYTKRFAYYVGRRCEAATVNYQILGDVAHNIHKSIYTRFGS